MSEKKEQVSEFDFSTITAFEFADFEEAVAKRNIRGITQGLTKMVVSCPYVAADADLTDPATYGNLPVNGAFAKIVEELFASGKK